jgi:Cu-Zn family superoxide dismutase
MIVAGCVPMAAPDVPVSTVNLVSEQRTVLGTVRVFSEPTGVMLRIDAAGVPEGQHGVHVHSVGRCDPPGFTSAGRTGTRRHASTDIAIPTDSTWATSETWA